MPEQDEIITLVDEEGNESDAIVYNILELDGNKYAIVIPVPDEDTEDEPDDEEDAGAYVLRVDQDEDGEEILVELEDDEWEKVKDACLGEFDFDEE